MALLVGLDVGSTTTKVYAMHEDMTEAWWGYRRHGACQTASVRAMLGELAERVDITPANLSILKNGKAKAIRFSTLEAICRELNCQPGDIIEYRPEETTE